MAREVAAGLANLLTVVGDNKYYLGRWLSQWAVGAPGLESAVAAAAIAQGHLGQARTLFAFIDELAGEGVAIGPPFVVDPPVTEVVDPGPPGGPTVAPNFYTGGACAALVLTCIPTAARDGLRVERSPIDVEREIAAIQIENGATAVRVDGDLNDEVWQSAPPVTTFVQREPSEGAQPSFRTEARVAYNNTGLYIAVRAFDPQPDRIVGFLTRRDEQSSSDWIRILIDSYHDRRTAYEFAVNPMGVKQDAYWFNDNSNDTSWDAVWDVVVSRDDQGWRAEFRIPFSQLRFSGRGNGSVGFAVVREVSKRTLQMRHFGTQLIGGMVLHEGKIAEMATGEGKTLVATLPSYLNALTGRGVHRILEQQVRDTLTAQALLEHRADEQQGPLLVLHRLDMRKDRHCTAQRLTNVGFKILGQVVRIMNGPVAGDKNMNRDESPRGRLACPQCMEPDASFAIPFHHFLDQPLFLFGKSRIHEARNRPADQSNP